MVNIYLFLLQHSDTGVKATWPITGDCYMVTLWLYLSFSVLIKGWAGPFMITLTMPRQSSWNATDRGLRAYDRSGWSVTNNYPLILCSYNNIQASFRKLLVQSI